MLNDLVLANHILADHEVVDSFGHISMRHPDRPDRYLLSCSRAPYLVSEDDIMEYTLENEPVKPDGRAMYLERPIHGRIYAARPDVNSICHNHAPSTIPFGVTGTNLKPIFHMAASIGSNVPIWDIAEKFGDTSLLVTNNAMGDDLAQTLGQSRVALMRGHGGVVTGKDVRDVVFTSIYLQANAQLLTSALALGKVRYLSDGEIEAATTAMLGPSPRNRAWESWVKRVTSAD